MKKRHNLQLARSGMVKGFNPRHLGISTLAIGLIFVLAAPLSAQTNFVVDLADPNVQVDLSVLNDGGLSPQMGAPAPMGADTITQSSTGGYQAPGAKTPVSRLYIKPSSRFQLPPQTKSIDAPVHTAVAKPKAQPMAPMPKLEPVPAPLPQPEPPVAMKSNTPPPPPPAAAVETPPPVPAPDAVAQEPEVSEKQEVAAILEKVPAAPEPSKPVDVTPAAPVPMPEPASGEEAEKVEPAQEVSKQPIPLDAPPPVEDEIKAAEPAPAPPQPPVASQEPSNQQAALTPPPPTPAPVEHDETDTTSSAQAANSDTMVIPPKPAANAEVAAVPPATGALTDGQQLRVLFDADSSKLAPAARDQLSAIASKLQNQDDLRLQLLAYAANPDMSASAARRLSLSRALAVRSFLIENGVRSTRIDVRALGNKSSDPQTERVDITVVER